MSGRSVFQSVAILVLASCPSPRLVCAGEVGGGVLDYSDFQSCLDDSGPAASIPPDCGAFDSDVDGDVDLLDVAALFNEATQTFSADRVLLPGGDFLMGDAMNDGHTSEAPRHWVHVDSLLMDRFEVTNQRYADALNWAALQGDLITVTSGVVYKHNSGTTRSYCDTTLSTSFSGITWDGSTFGVVAGREDHPMVTVSWYGAAAYANWRSTIEGRTACYDTTDWNCDFVCDGYRLPTEAEWEYAARGGIEGMRFPWSDSNAIQHTRGNYFSYAMYPYDTSPTRRYHPTFDTGVHPFTSPVGYFPPNGFGLFDMAGNALEWCNDRYSSSYYAVNVYPVPPRGPATGSNRVLRGGSWTDNAGNQRCAARMYTTPGNRLDFFGFRLVLEVHRP